MLLQPCQCPRVCPKSNPHPRCITCKQRKKKCDEVKPTCAACERNLLLCAWPDPTRKEQPRRRSDSARKSCPASAPIRSLRVVSPTPEYQSFQRGSRTCKQKLPENYLSPFPPVLRRLLERCASRTLFEHFLLCTAPNLATTPASSNPWTSLALAYMQENETFLHSILAISSAHINSTSPDVLYAGYVHYGLALKGLKHALTIHNNGKSEILPLAVTSLSLALYEVGLYICTRQGISKTKSLRRVSAPMRAVPHFTIFQPQASCSGNG